MNNSDKDVFNYTYSAKEQDEIKTIRKKYAPSNKTVDKMTQLRRLDASVNKKATVFSLVIGIIGSLIMGSGMSLAMTDIGDVLGMTGGTAMLIGIIVGIIGMVFVCLAYPVYNIIVKNERKKIAPEIIRLTDELMK